MDIRQSYFELFSLPEQYQVDQQSLIRRYRKLQKGFHPDRYVSSPDRERRIALQYSSYINEAYTCLKSPLKRAHYLLIRQGVERDSAHTMSSDPEFLMQQMQWRESLAQISKKEEPDQALEKLREEIDQQLSDLQRQFANDYLAGNYTQALQLVEKMHFLEKLNEEIEALEGQLLDY